MTSLHDDSRLSVAEATLRRHDLEFDQIKKSLDAIQDSLSKSRTTNWPLVFMGLGLLGALYAAAIRPLEADIGRSTRAAETLAQAVVVQDKSEAILRNDLTRVTEQLTALAVAFEHVRSEGSPLTDKRLTLLEYQLKERGSK